MQIAQDLSGFTLGQADILRRAMGKKKKEEIEELRSTFIEGAVKKKVNERYAANLFDQIEQFAGYGFNRSHSVGYALIAYQTAWLKAHYPSEFMASVMSCDLGNTDSIQIFVDDCKNIGLNILKPDINRSSYRFEDIDSSTILYGLGAIKGIGKSLVSKIVEEREKTQYKDLLDFCIRVGFNSVNKRILTALIGSGAMDCLGERNFLFSRIESCLRNSEQVAERDKSNIQDFFGDEVNKVIVNEENIQEIEFDRVSAEWSALGFYLESHPLETKKKEVRNMCGFFISELQAEEHPQRIAGTLVHLNVRQGRRGRFAFATLDDSSGRIEVSVWAEVFDNCRSLLKKGQLIVVEGIVDRDEYGDKKSYKIIADRILTFDQARKEYIKNISIQLDNKFDQESVIKVIRELATPEEGNKVRISYEADEASAEIELPQAYSISLKDENIKILKNTFGKDNINFVYHSRPHLN